MGEERAAAEYEDGAEQVVVEAAAVVVANSSATGAAQEVRPTYYSTAVRQAEVSAAGDPAAAADLDIERPVSTAAVEVAVAVSVSPAELSAAAVRASLAPRRTYPFHRSPLCSSRRISSSLCLSARLASPRARASSSSWRLETTIGS